jgi:uncharacterized protein YkwD
MKTLALLTLSVIPLALSVPGTAHADNRRLNDGVVANIYTIQHQAGCDNDLQISPQLRQAAQWHVGDLMANRNLVGDIGSDGSTPADRARAAAYDGTVAETVAVNPAIAINGVEILRQWYYNQEDMAIMSNCANAEIGVWSENSIDRTVVVAVYGAPA